MKKLNEIIDDICDTIIFLWPVFLLTGILVGFVIKNI